MTFVVGIAIMIVSVMLYWRAGKHRTFLPAGVYDHVAASRRIYRVRYADRQEPTCRGLVYLGLSIVLCPLGCALTAFGPLAERALHAFPAISVIAPGDKSLLLPSHVPDMLLGDGERLRPVQVQASATAPPGKDSQGSTVTYAAANVSDGDPETAWRVPGTGIGESLTLTFAVPVTVRQVAILPGYAKVDPVDGTDRFLQNRRVRAARLEFSDGSSMEVTFTAARALQPIVVSPPQKTTFVRVVIRESTAPSAVDGRDFVAISEIVVLGTS